MFSRKISLCVVVVLLLLLCMVGVTVGYTDNYPFKFMFTIMGVGAFATQFLDLFANALMVGITYTVIRFALFVWKGAAYDN